MITAMMILLVVLAGSAGDVVITKGMKEVGEISTVRPGELWALAKQVFSNKCFLGGLALMTISFFAWIAALSVADLSLVLPATSLSFVITTIGAKLILKERISRMRWAGTVLVCAGIALISLS